MRGRTCARRLDERDRLTGQGRTTSPQGRRGFCGKESEMSLGSGSGWLAGSGVREPCVVPASVVITHVPSQLARDRRRGPAQPRRDCADTHTPRLQARRSVPAPTATGTARSGCPPATSSVLARPSAPASSSRASGRSRGGGMPRRCRLRHRSASSTHPREQAGACVLVVPSPPFIEPGVLRRVVERKVARGSFSADVDTNNAKSPASWRHLPRAGRQN